MLSHNYLPIIAFMARNKDSNKDNSSISYYIYRKQHKDVNFQINYDKKVDNINKQAKKIADILEKSIQQEIDRKK